MKKKKDVSSVFVSLSILSYVILVLKLYLAS